ncbi:YetF domain-containing protein [Ammoniphilus sp. 3BR4]|uniref:YetF domain-containing protein n=1 Tax=Ammoniphilus sp. 3BR4 TaxID=3158265 RepID=UPI003465795C
MNHYLTLTIELILGFFALFFLMKLLGKNQFSQITPFNFISALILGELLGNAVYDHEVKMTEILFAVTLWGTLIFSVEKITQKYKGTRKFLEGEPNIVIRRGEIKYDTLKKSNMDLNQLKGLIRLQGYFSLDQVEYAILETNGMVSVLPKSQYATPSKSDFNMPIHPVELPVTLIIDGEVVYNNLKEAGVDEQWLKSQLSMQNIADYKEVVYAEWRNQQSLYAVRYD